MMKSLEGQGALIIAGILLTFGSILVVMRVLGLNEDGLFKYPIGLIALVIGVTLGVLVHVLVPTW